MKKVLSVFLAIMMLMSYAVLASAAGSDITVNVAKKVTLGVSETKFSFKAPETGVYRLSIKCLSRGYVYAAIPGLGEEDDYYAVWSSSENVFEDSKEDSSECFVAKKGQTVTIFAANSNEGYVDEYGDEIVLPSTSSAEILISSVDAESVASGREYRFTGETYYLFIPTKSGYYNFRSASDDFTDADIYVMDASDFSISSNLDGFDSLEFDYNNYFVAGNVYMIQCLAYTFHYDEEGIVYDDGFNGNSKFKIADGSNITADNIICSENSIEMDKGDQYSIAVFYDRPAAAAVADDFIIDSSRPRVCTVDTLYGYETEGYREILITGLRAGRTTLTVTDPASGSSTEIEVKVNSSFTTWWRNLMSSIMEFFHSIFGGGIQNF